MFRISFSPYKCCITMLIHEIYVHYLHFKYCELAMPSARIAALLLQGGRTVHSRLMVSIFLNELSVCSISKQSALAKLIQSAKLLAWDEIPMIHRHAVECIDRRLRRLLM